MLSIFRKRTGTAMDAPGQSAGVTNVTPPRDTETLIHRQAQQIIHLRAALREIEAMPYRSRKAQDVARRGLQCRTGDYFKVVAAKRVRETS